MASLLNGAGGAADGIEDPRLQVESDKPVRIFHLLSFIIPCSQNAGSRNLWSFRYTRLHS